MKKLLSGAALAAALPLAFAQNNTLIPTLTCLSRTAELNTAYDGAGAQQLTPGAADPQWFVGQRGFIGNDPTSVPPASSWVAALVPSPVSASWVTTTGPGAVFTDAAWLSPRLDSQSAPGDWWPRPTPETANPYFNFYRVQFNLAPEVPPAALRIRLNYYLDDAVNGAFVNGVYRTMPTAGFGAGGEGAADISTGWVTGLNTLVFSVSDNGWATGFLARATADESVCTQSPIRVTKAADQSHYQPGDTATYTVTVTSLGTTAVTGASLADPAPPGLSNVQWSCTAAAGATCPSPAGPFPVGFDLPGQGVLTFSLTGTVTGAASLDNTATITPGTGGVCAADTGCTASVAPTYTVAPPAPPHPVPGLGAWALMALSATLGGLVAVRRERGRTAQ